ncbi:MULTISPECIES: hypothetical protein [Agrobacterium]|uniref:hypothetical protein n=1 Tax=Agrobacterium TaxID=357 RepID=UPI0027832B13|nr:hypothetical protein [Agrobacterium sp. SORGH_AS_0745]MDP9759077.1 hypothetical protein [Agrobacterium tumefaciens]MDQ1220328.1 hypothetical protein [Agrobacterium sp. SORGH_AS_0745]
MNLAKFKDEPWKTSHPAYENCNLAMSPAPEYASSEVILSSLYRQIGLKGASEGSVPQSGRHLEKEVQRSRNKVTAPVMAVLDANTFNGLLHSVLESPKLPNQSAKRFVQVTPLVPQAAIFSGSARLSSNSWPAGALVKRMVRIGSPEQASANKLWERLFDALSVSSNDDIFARFLQEEIGAWSPEPSWEFIPLEAEPGIDEADLHQLNYPAKRFVRDLEAIISAKDAMTRRQWTSLLEAIIRIATVAHITWICDVHAGIWDCVRQAIAGNGPSNPEEVRARLFPASFHYFAYGDKALLGIKDKTSAFLRARIGLNAVLWAAQDADYQYASLSSSQSILDLCAFLQGNAEKVQQAGLNEALIEVTERETRTLLCKKGIGSNIMEFARHVLGQRQAANPVLRGYDQGFALRKKGTSNSSPWVVGLGPVATLALVHCALYGTNGPRSVKRLTQHLAGYGMIIDYHDIAKNELGNQLRLLGLVLDSPDAESGMLLSPPFATGQENIA